MTDHDELERVRQLQEQKDSGEPPVEGDADVLPHQPPTEPSPLPPEMAVTFGANFFPQPFGYIITRGTFQDRSSLWLTFEHAHGRIAFPLSDLEAQGMANRLTQMARDQLVIAKDIPHAPG